MLLLSGYDYTLDESGVEKDEKTNKQEYVNNNSKVGVRALAMMAGYRRKHGCPLCLPCLLVCLLLVSCASYPIGNWAYR